MKYIEIITQEEQKLIYKFSTGKFLCILGIVSIRIFVQFLIPFIFSLQFIFCCNVEFLKVCIISLKFFAAKVISKLLSNLLVLYTIIIYLMLT